MTKGKSVVVVFAAVMCAGACWRVPADRGIMEDGIVRRRFITAGMAVTTIMVVIGGAAGNMRVVLACAGNLPPPVYSK